MYKKLIMSSWIMALLEITVGCLMIAEILNVAGISRMFGLIWIFTGILKLFLIIKTKKTMKINMVNKLFVTLTIMTLGLLITCWMNPLTAIPLIIYVPILIFFLLGWNIQNKI